MNDLVVKFQNTTISMIENNKLTQEEFDILANLSEDIEDQITLELVLNLKLSDLKDRDIIDCILAKQFKTALYIIMDVPDHMEWSPWLGRIAAQCAEPSFWEK